MKQAASLIYDGECPFCSRFARLIRLRTTLNGLKLIDARDGGPEVEVARALGYRLDEGMILYMDGAYYHGPDCMNRLALMSSRSDAFNQLAYMIFRSERLSRILYPVLRKGRAVALAFLGRKPLGY